MHAIISTPAIVAPRLLPPTPQNKSSPLSKELIPPYGACLQARLPGSMHENQEEQLLVPAQSIASRSVARTISGSEAGNLVVSMRRGKPARNSVDQVRQFQAAFSPQS